MTTILAILSSGDAAAIEAKWLRPDQAALIGAIVTILTLVFGKLAHSAVTPLADPKNDAGVPLVPVNAAPTSLAR